MLPLSFKEIMEYYVAGSWMKYCPAGEAGEAGEAGSLSNYFDLYKSGGLCPCTYIHIS